MLVPVPKSPAMSSVRWPSILATILSFSLLGFLPASGQEEVTEAAKAAQADLASKPVLASPKNIGGRLLDLDGITSHFNVKIKLIRLPDQTVVAETVTDSVGNYSFPPVPPGEYTMQIGEAFVRILAAPGMPVQPINLVVPKFLLTAAPVPAVGTAAAAAAATTTTTTVTTATWVGGTVAVVGAGTVGATLAGIDIIPGLADALGVADDEVETVTVTPKKIIPPTPEPEPSTEE